MSSSHSATALALNLAARCSARVRGTLAATATPTAPSLDDGEAAKEAKAIATTSSASGAGGDRASRAGGPLSAGRAGAAHERHRSTRTPHRLGRHSLTRSAGGSEARRTQTNAGAPEVATFFRSSEAAKQPPRGSKKSSREQPNVRRMGYTETPELQLITHTDGRQKRTTAPLPSNRGPCPPRSRCTLRAPFLRPSPYSFLYVFRTCFSSVFRSCCSKPYRVYEKRTRSKDGKRTKNEDGRRNMSLHRACAGGTGNGLERGRKSSHEHG